MYVILDLEWVTSKSGQSYPTQLAAARVDTQWNIIDTYATLFAPQPGQCLDISQVGCTGHEMAEYENSRCAKAVIFGLLDWLKADDILCWWQAEARDFFDECCYTHMDRSCPQNTLILYEYALASLNGIKGIPQNPYRIAKRLGIQTPELMHESMNDIKAITALLSGIDFDQRLLLSSPQSITVRTSDRRPLDTYLVETQRGIIHKPGCTMLTPDCDVIEYPYLKTCIRHQFKPCKCCETEYRAAYRQRSEEIIAKSEYNYLFSEHSKVFHKYTCGCMKNARSILGTIYYGPAAATGREPCKLCHPSPNDIPRPDAYADKKRASIQRNSGRTLSKKDKQALSRYERAKAERIKATANLYTMDAKDKHDYITLTQPSYAFWAATGYSTFHTRNCSKMKGLKGLKGFSKYSEAIRSGYTPCKCCKPTAKMDVAVSIPLSSKERDGESPVVLEDVCKKNGYAFSHNESLFTLETPVGIWRINISTKPYSIHHINLAMTPNNRSNFHRQPKMFLSLADAITYIQKHDEALISKVQTNQYIGRAGQLRIS